MNEFKMPTEEAPSSDYEDVSSWRLSSCVEGYIPWDTTFPSDLYNLQQISL